MTLCFSYTFYLGVFSPNKLISLFIEEGVNPSFTESFSSSHSALNIYLKAPTSSKSCYSGSLNCEKDYNVMIKHRKSQQIKPIMQNIFSWVMHEPIQLSIIQ